MDSPRLSDEQRLQLESHRTEEWSPSQMGVWFGAEAPPSGTKVPGYYYKLGDFLDASYCYGRRSEDHILDSYIYLL